MPLLQIRDHEAPFWLPNGHFQSIYPSLFRKIKDVSYTRERIETSDDDFLNLDWAQAKQPSKGLVILSHGLEGDSSRQYILGMVRALTHDGYDCLAWNYRSCGGEMNRQLRFYHSGATDDLDLVVQHAINKGHKALYMMGFSLGGNLTLKYLGERGKQLDPRIKRSVVFSVPMDLLACSRAIEQPQNRVYLRRFLSSLKPKVVQKAKLYPDRISIEPYARVKTFYDFDHVYTAALHGFADADDYYRQNSSRFFVESINIPTLIVNSANDPLVPAESLPQALIAQLQHVWLELTEAGGHCGFRPARLKNGIYWSEQRALEFLDGEHYH